MPKRSLARRRIPALAQATAAVNRLVNPHPCVALILPLIGLGMRCPGGRCPRCTELAAEVKRLRPEWEREKAAWQAAHPEKATAPKPTPGIDDTDDPEDGS